MTTPLAPPKIILPADPTVKLPPASGPAVRLPEYVKNETPPSVGDNTPDNRPIPDLAQQRIDLRLEDFIRFINQHGQRVMWRKAMTCTCRNEETDQAVLNCAICRSVGVRYVAAQEVRAIFQQHDSRTKIYEKFGTWLEGMAQVSIEAQYRLAYRDSLELLDAVSATYETIVKNNRKTYRRNLPAGSDVARYRIVSMTHMIARVPVRSAVVGTPQYREIVPEQNLDYEIRDGLIWWLPRGSRIPDGSLISIRYDFRPVYLVLHMPHATRNDVTGTLVPSPVHRAYPLAAGVQIDSVFDATLDAKGQRIGNGNEPTMSASTGPICECSP